VFQDGSGGTTILIAADWPVPANTRRKNPALGLTTEGPLARGTREFRTATSARSRLQRESRTDPKTDVAPEPLTLQGGKRDETRRTWSATSARSARSTPTCPQYGAQQSHAAAPCSELEAQPRARTIAKLSSFPRRSRRPTRRAVRTAARDTRRQLPQRRTLGPRRGREPNAAPTASGPTEPAILRSLRSSFGCSTCLPLSGFTHSWTLSSEFFSTFPRGTCSLSVSWWYLALGGVYLPLWAALSSNPTPRKEPLPRIRTSPTGLAPSMGNEAAAFDRTWTLAADAQGALVLP